MALSNGVVEKISWQVIDVLYSRFHSFPEDSTNNRNAPFHEAFLNAFSNKLAGKVSDIPFFVTLSSWLHGLNTTLGQTFFENAAHILSAGEKREYTSKKRGNLKIGNNQRNTVGNIIANLSNSKRISNLCNENIELFISDTYDMDAMDFSADVFIEDDNEIVAIELKSVRPNSGEMRGEKQKILEGRAALYNTFQGKKVNFFIGFPFDPTSPTSTGSDKKRFMGSIINMTKYFAEEEVLLANELWDYLSGDSGTMQQLLDIINTIAKPDFLDNYNLINEPKNKIENSSKYIQQLKDWNLHSEVELVEKESSLLSNIAGDKRGGRLLKQAPFKQGKYNNDRYNTLKVFL